MELETERLRIVQMHEMDLEEIHIKNSMNEVAEFNTIGIPKNFEVTKEIYKSLINASEENNELRFTIRLKKENTFIGEIGLKNNAPRFKMAEIHYSLLPKYWKQGFALEAVKAIINYGFNELKLHRIEAGVATENLNSIQLLEKVGMTKEGIRRKILPIRGEWKDNFHYAMLEEDKRDY